MFVIPAYQLRTSCYKSSQHLPVAEVDSDGELDNAADWRWGTDDCVL